MNVLIVAGEHSGDLLGVELIRELKKRIPDSTYFGIGGAEMQSEGFQSIANLEEMNVIGFTGVLSKYKFLKSLALQLIAMTEEKPTHCVILIDYPGFNLKFAEMLQGRKIPIVFHVSPQIWAWRFKRIFKIKEYVNLMLPLFKFEHEIYSKYGVNSVFTGHPARLRIQSRLQSRPPVVVPKGVRTICLMPGSRTSEISRLTKLLLNSAIELHRRFSQKAESLYFLVPGISEQNEGYILDCIQAAKQEEPNLQIEYKFDSSIECIQASELVLLASGTATLEVGILEKPMVIVYKMSYVTYWIGKSLAKTKHAGLVNILSNDTTICKEFIQGAANQQNVVEESVKILTDPEYRATMIQNLKKIKEQIGYENPAEKAAKSILELIQKN